MLSGLSGSFSHPDARGRSARSGVSQGQRAGPGGWGVPDVRNVRVRTPSRSPSPDSDSEYRFEARASHFDSEDDTHTVDNGQWQSDDDTHVAYDEESRSGEPETTAWQPDADDYYAQAYAHPATPSFSQRSTQSHDDSSVDTVPYVDPGDNAGHDWDRRLSPPSDLEESTQYSPYERSTDSPVSSGELRRQVIRDSWMDDSMDSQDADMTLTPYPDALRHELSETMAAMATTGQSSLSEDEQCALLFRIYQGAHAARVDPRALGRERMPHMARLGDGLFVTADGDLCTQREFAKGDVVCAVGGYVISREQERVLSTFRVGNALGLPRFPLYILQLGDGWALDANPCVQASRDHVVNKSDRERAPGALALQTAQRAMLVPRANVRYRVLHGDEGSDVRVPVLVAAARLPANTVVVMDPRVTEPEPEDDTVDEFVSASQELEMRDESSSDDEEWPTSPYQYSTRAMPYAVRGRAMGGARAGPGGTASIYSYMDASGQWTAVPRFSPAQPWVLA